MLPSKRLALISLNGNNSAVVRGMFSWSARIALVARSGSAATRVLLLFDRARGRALGEIERGEANFAGVGT